MKLLPFIFLLFAFYNSFSQQDKFQIEGRVINEQHNPIADAYILNFRDLDKNITNSNGVFSIWALPGDSLIISHVSYFRKVVTVHSLLSNPVILLEMDTINIQEVNVSPNQRTDSEKAMENIKSIEFDFRPQPYDDFTEGERMQLLMNSENRVQRTEASSVNLLKFSPSEQIGKIFKKIKRRKKSKQYKSTKKKTEHND